MKRTVLSIFIVFTLLAQSFAWEETTQIHGAAVSTDGEWNAVSILDDTTKQESIWVYRTQAWWSKPAQLIAFNPQGGWAVPTVCYDQQSKSFIVYHNCWHPENDDGGIYEFPLIDGKYSSKNFYHTAVSEYPLNYSILRSNTCGVYLLSNYGGWTGTENRNARLFKLVKNNEQYDIVIPAAIKDVDFAHIDWRDGDAKPKHENVHRDIFFSTDSGLIIQNVDASGWYYFDCVDETLTEFSTKEEAYAFDLQLTEKRIAEKHAGNKRTQLWEILLIVAALLIIVAVLVMIVFLFKKRLSEKQKVPVVADLDTKERNRFVFGIQETERAKISRDIHDSVVQDIRVIRLETENLEVAEKSKRLQQKIEDIATDCIVKLRNICYNLAPAELANHSSGNSSQIELVSIINSLSQQFTVRTHVPCTVGVEDGFEYPSFEKETTQNIFRVVQEALNNIEKHSYATNVSVFIKREAENDKNQIVIYITDDGIGCKKEKLEEMMASKDHLGLRSMKDRMELIGGSIEYISDQDDGMEIKLMIPVKAE